MENSFILITGYIIITLASTVQGMTGFGFGLMTVPFLSLLIYPKTVIPVVLIYTVIISAAVLYHARRHVEVKRIYPLLLAAVIGLYPGTLLLKLLPADILRIYIGITITFFALLMLFGFRARIKNERRAYLPVGLTSGVLSGSLSIGGPPVILFFTNQATAKDTFRANLSFYFFVLNILTIPIYVINDIINLEVLKSALIFSPALILGSLAGILFSSKVNEDHFRRIALVLVALGGVSSLLTGLTN